MTILRRPKTITRRRNLLLVATALIFVAPCVAAAPFSLRIGVDPQSPAVSSDDSVVAPHASDVVVQQGAGQKAKQEEKATEERRYKLIEVRKERSKPNVSWIEAGPQKAPKLRDASPMQETDVIKNVRKAEAKLRDENEAKKPVLKPKVLRELGPPDKYILKRVAAKKTSNAELAKKANITMQQAIQIAISQQPGTALQCRLISEQPAGERDQVFYILTIVSGDDQKSASTTMLISAVDGRVVRTWKNER